MGIGNSRRKVGGGNIEMCFNEVVVIKKLTYLTKNGIKY